MLYLNFKNTLSARKSALGNSLAALGLLIVAFSPVFAQSYQREFDTPDKVSVSVKNPTVAWRSLPLETQQKKVAVEANSRGSAIDSTDLQIEAEAGDIRIDVRDRGEKDRIDLVVRIPLRSKATVETEAGAVDISGNIESAEVTTNTGTIHADVPLEALKFNFLWQSSRPRYLSEVELPDIKEKRGGFFSISGKLGEKNPKKEERVELNFLTRRGVVLLNVDPEMVPE